MTIHPVFLLLLLGHVVGDFYLQWETMAKLKNTSWKWLAAHGVIYTSCMALALFAGIDYSRELLWLFLAAGASHLAVDYLKRFIPWKTFSVDQLTHLLLLGAAWWIWGQRLMARGFMAYEAGFLPGRPVLLVILGLLCVIRPAGALIKHGDIWDFDKNKITPNEAQKGAGKMIGYLERIIVFFLLAYGQYGAIAFVLTAKSIARFPEISDDKSRAQAEYYLIGTLLSMTSVFAATLLLGLVKT